jgi:hypothetical protein
MLFCSQRRQNRLAVILFEAQLQPAATLRSIEHCTNMHPNDIADLSRKLQRQT